MIDGVHIPIQSPGGKQSELYRNRKGISSINCQVLCEHKHKLGGQVAFTTAEYGTIPSCVWNLKVGFMRGFCWQTVAIHYPDKLWSHSIIRAATGLDICIDLKEPVPGGDAPTGESNCYDDDPFQSGKYFLFDGEDVRDVIVNRFVS